MLDRVWRISQFRIKQIQTKTISGIETQLPM